MEDSVVLHSIHSARLARPQYAMVLGDCIGGALKVWDSNGGTQEINYTNKILKLDGRLHHEVMPFTGLRYCIIWYKVFDRNMPAAVHSVYSATFRRKHVVPPAPAGHCSLHAMLVRHPGIPVIPC